MERYFYNNHQISPELWEFLERLLAPMSMIVGTAIIYLAENRWQAAAGVGLYIGYNIAITKFLRTRQIAPQHEFLWLFFRCQLSSLLITLLALVSRDPYSFWLLVIVQVPGDTFSFEKPAPKVFNLLSYSAAVFTGLYLIGVSFSKFHFLFLLILSLVAYAFLITTIHLRRKTEQAEAANLAKGTFLANMSHDIRTPMNAILGYAELILEGDHTPEQAEHARRLKSNSDILLSLIDDILDYSKIEAGELNLEPTPCSAAEVMKNIDSVAHVLASRKPEEITLHRTLDHRVPEYFYTDSLRLHQILNNLVSNAVKFTRHGSIEYGVSRSNENTLEFFVSDTGAGIPPEMRQAIFDPFRQVDDSNRRRQGGTGLGLAISKSLVELMGGKLGLRSREQGSTFYFTLPLKEAPAPGETRPTRSESKPRRRRVLLVEDNIDNRLLIKRMLEQGGDEVLLAENGQQALDVFGENRSLDIILMDVQMPVMDGLEATRRIRAMEQQETTHTPVPIFALTAGAMKGDREKCMAAGCNDYITKPITGQRLRETLAAIQA